MCLERDRSCKECAWDSWWGIRDRSSARGGHLSRAPGWEAGRQKQEKAQGCWACRGWKWVQTGSEGPGSCTLCGWRWVQTGSEGQGAWARRGWRWVQIGSEGQGAWARCGWRWVQTRSEGRGGWTRRGWRWVQTGSEGWGSGHALVGGEFRQEVRAGSLNMHDIGITGEAQWRFGSLSSWRPRKYALSNILLLISCELTVISSNSRVLDLNSQSSHNIHFLFELTTFGCFSVSGSQDPEWYQGPQKMGDGVGGTEGMSHHFINHTTTLGLHSSKIRMYGRIDRDGEAVV